jgi:glutamate N-acetyltransferase/amino-acid N-acetyltransferase
LALASGASGVTVEAGDAAFQQALEQVCIELAQAIVKDGEGATKFVTLEIVNGPDEPSTKSVARAIATSPLCKTAFYGADPNWGRIIAAAGRSGVPINPDALDLWLIAADGTSVQLLAAGQPTDFDEPAAIALMKAHAFTFRLDLHMGSSSVTVWTCDLSHEYVTINAEYRT